VESILKGDFPDDNLEPDQQVSLINVIAAELSRLDPYGQGEQIMDEVNNFALWLGGQPKDLQVYAWQLIRRVKGIDVLANDKTAVRLRPLEDKIFQGEPYEADTYQDITHFAWPKQFLDGSTFEERLEVLAEDFESDESPADLLLSGVSVPEDLDFNQRFQLAQDCIQDIVSQYQRYGKATIITDERIDRFFGWLLTIEDDIALFSIRSLLSISRGKVTCNLKNLKNWHEVCDRWSDIIPKV